MLEVRLLGQFDVRRDGRPVEIASRPAQSLLAYLLLNAGAPHRREKLAGLFWPDAAEANARSNLRHALWRLRKALGSPPDPDYFQADDFTVTFDAQAGLWLDTARLDQELDKSRSTDDLISTVALYRGELLPGSYDDWIVLERERLHAVFERRMQVLMDRLVEAQRWVEVLEWGERWIALGRTPEPAYRSLMVAHGALGDVSSVAAVYQRCVEALQRELGVEPSEQTRALYERLSTGAKPAGLPA